MPQVPELLEKSQQGSLTDLERPTGLPRGEALFSSSGKDVCFSDPIANIETNRSEEVGNCLQSIEQAVAGGLYAAGFVAYEAASAFDPALVTHDSGELPLLRFGLYQRVESRTPEPPGAPDYEVGPWSSLISETDYRDGVRRIREWIAAGHTYQVNYTFPMRASFQGSVESWYRHLCRAQGAAHCALLQTGRFSVLCISPERFFRLDGDSLETRPMKGTRPRGRWLGEDIRLRQELEKSDKDRAENVMIVDLLRNDMGRISKIGSVQVVSLFDIERYESVWQMTSSIQSRCRTPLSDIFRALFPSGSVTGAPKIRTMQIIRELEPFPRGVYCGAVGWAGPGRQAEFNVAIRTVTVDHDEDTATYHVGSGITWDSAWTSEFEECLSKAAFLSGSRPDFELLESLLFDGAYFLLEEHLARLRSSAEFFGFKCDRPAILSALQQTVQDRCPASLPLKVRLFLAREGRFRIQTELAQMSQRVRLGLALEPVDDRDVFLFHKTTHRQVYDAAKASRPDCDDVLLWNRRGEITETCTANVVLELDGMLWTPPIASGLLAGTMRAHLLASGAIRERLLTRNDLARAKSIRLINSVRKWIEVEFGD
ncbi:MAG: aminodeoxychorismate synthase component I [Candidatus Hydrogenedentes bacterium]|nr:aminodeoxychorismate synthase component I [Candidatus Hydrogenedentota bacterium]